MSSEVAQLLQRIEQEYQAAQWALTGLASGSARHDFINQRMENIGGIHEELKAQVGSATAMNLMASSLWSLEEGTKVQDETCG
jgi:hypothetical protein